MGGNSLRTRRWAAIFTLGLLGAALPLVAATPAAAQTAVFVNEIHYDNTGTDAGEAIEVAGPAGTDLTGWTLVLYNGNGGAIYDTETLPAGPLADLGDGFGVVSVPADGLQNGSPDGIALVDDSGAVVQFLSYEGTFTAVGGPAARHDQHRHRRRREPVRAGGQSLQLTGTGTSYEDFTWADPATATFGAANTGQTFGDDGGGDPPWVNEIHYDNTGADAGEAIEVAGPAGTDLTGWTLVLYNGSNGTSYDTEALPAGPLGDLGDGFGVVSVPAVGIQNGSPDGIALVDDSGDAGAVPVLRGDLRRGGWPGRRASPASTSACPRTGRGAVGNSLQLTGTGTSYEDFTWAAEAPNTFGAANTGQFFGDGPPPFSCEGPATLTPISAIQGSGATSPLTGQPVVVQAAVTAVMPGLSGFYVQEEPADDDADPATSDGVFVFASAPAGVVVGDVVRIGATVAEFVTSGGLSSLTELTGAAVAECAVDPVAIAPPPSSSR